jgi:O-methyltransferase
MCSERAPLSRKELRRLYKPRPRLLPKVTNRETPRQKALRFRRRFWGVIVPTLWKLAWNAGTSPAAAFFILYSAKIDPAYRMTTWRKAALAWRMGRTTRKVVTGTSWRAHLAMALKLLEMPPDEPGVVVECGSFQGGSTANLSLICSIVGRELIVYDSFEGLPPPTEGDWVANEYGTGLYAGSLETVKDHVCRYGNIDVCTFRKGWYSETLPKHREPIALAFLDVDYQQSLHDCLINLWPKLRPKGFVFLDDYLYLELCAVFWSERYWKTYFDTTPPGLLGSGSGIPLGTFYPGPFQDWRMAHTRAGTAYTRKDLHGVWDFFPE